jgi:Kef-type K+ transport system membrane component KefB
VVLVVGTNSITYALDRDPVAWWLPVVIGYAVGTLAGELLRPVERRPDQTRASLEPRRVRHFIVPHFLVAVGVVFAASLVPAVFLLLDDPQRPWNDGAPSPNEISRPQDWYVVVLVLASIGAAAAGVLGTRALAQAPIPADTPDRLAVRHAIRSAAIMAVVGASVMISGAVGAKLASAAVWLDQSAPVAVRALNGIAVGIGALGALWGAMLTLSTIPRIAPFSGTLPSVPDAEPARTV